MNIIKFIEQFTDENLMNRKSSRRDSFNGFKKIGANTALAALPLGIASLVMAPTKANAASAAFMSTMQTPTAALQLALILEYLEDEFYQIALDTNGLIPASDQTIIAQISQHESAHVQFLMSALGDMAPQKPDFDFTVGGAFPTFEDYPTFLALSQAFEDTGVRAYKGQAGNLMSNGDLLTAGLQIHSVEARHASQIRRLRGQKGWIIGNDRGGLPPEAQAVYDGEENTMQAGFNTANVTPTNGPAIPPSAGPESFDEFLTGDEATAIANLFIV
mgnify:CR=1 FL=1